jgi:NTP pyrophosphatase (non-canonical NTP hydrolase)
MDKFERCDDMFIENMRGEILKARRKFPAPNPTIAALVEEVGELAQAALHIREGKHADWWKVWDEAMQVAVMAMRMATEGDATIGAVPNEENCR